MTASAEELLAPMDCKEVQELMHPYVDGEFAAEERARFAAHLTGCERCRCLVTFEESFKAGLRARLAKPGAPPALRERIGAALDAAPAPSHGVGWHARRWGPVAAAAGVLALLAVRSHGSNEIARDIAGSHARNLPVEVTGPDASRIRSWFDGKVGFPVDPPRLAGARLVGGRLSNIHDRETAYLQYRAGNGSRVSVFVFDPQELQVPAQDVRRIGGREVYFNEARGYHVAAFQDHGVGYAIASDLDEDQVARLVSASFTP